MAFFTILGIIFFFFICKFIYDSIIKNNTPNNILIKIPTENFNQGILYSRLAETAIKNNDLDTAIDYLRKAVSCNPSIEHYKEELFNTCKKRADQLCEISRNYYIGNNRLEAFKYIKEAHLIFPVSKTLLEAYLLMGLEIGDEEVLKIIKENG